MTNTPLTQESNMQYLPAILLGLKVIAYIGKHIKRMAPSRLVQWLLGFDSDCTVIIWESIRPSRDIARIASMADSVHSGEFSLKEIAENESESIDERVWFGTVDNAEAWLDQNGSPEERFVAVVFNEDALEDLIT